MPFNVTYSKIKTFVNGGKIYPGDVDDALDDLGVQLASVNVAGGFNEGSNVRRGKCIVPGAETRTNAAYGLMTTPDQVQNVVLPTDALMIIAFQAMWKESVAGAAEAAIFLNSVQYKRARPSSATPVTTSAAIVTAGQVGLFTPLATSAVGLRSLQGQTASATYTGDVTTGQVLGAGDADYGVCFIDNLASGTYNVSIQFRSSSGSVTAQSRRLKVWTENF